MPTTSNFGWTTPADTDLVKDGAAAIRTLGNGIDTSLVDLKGGTTGQVLSKNSNTDLDYTWVTPNVGDITEVQAGTGISVASGTGPIPVVTNTVATAYDAKGDLIVGTGADTFAKLTVGTNGHTLVADSATATGLKWAAAPSPSYAWQTWTPSYTAITVGNGTVVARYAQIDKIVFVFWRLTCGSTSSWSNDPRFTLPINYNRQGGADAFGLIGGTYFDSSGSIYYPNGVYLTDTTAFLQTMRHDISASIVSIENYSSSNSRPASAGAANGDVISVQFWYEVA